ncbi:hypothetical protein CHARACLAT_030552 [Characodon lateralis]|uniref:Uncharacterized protein n=1 Tax=Characodon lateralis TaxID=208331 RepID=A0ABU7CUN6_9TELE|nr:hypothetical protein [Characodon lateralis]
MTDWGFKRTNNTSAGRGTSHCQGSVKGGKQAPHLMGGGGSMASHPQHTTHCDGKTRPLRNDTSATTHKHNRADSIELTSTLRSQPNSSSPREKKARPQQRKEKIKINM